ncbi:MAG: hypothetical protein WAK48_10360 [Candidatus Acidiferrum sp.]
MTRFLSRPLFLRFILPVLALGTCLAISFGVLHLHSASPTVDKTSLQLATVQSGAMICRVDGLGSLVPADVRWPDDSVQIAQGLQPGDRIIVSDMSSWHHYQHLQIK